MLSLCAAPAFPWKRNCRKAHLAPDNQSPIRGFIMTDIIWLSVLAGLFLLTLAYVRLCDHA
jgi:hypothetical protein